MVRINALFQNNTNLKKKVNIMKKILHLASILVWIFASLIPQKVYAQNAATLVSAIQTWNLTNGGTGTLDATADGSEVIVTGAVADATSSLSLNIGAGVVVNWKASISTTNNIRLTGNGEFRLTSGKIERLGVDDLYAIWSTGNNPIIMENGEITGGIWVQGASSKITVSGGTIKRTHDVLSTIFIDNVGNTGLNVDISGNANISQEGAASTISSHGIVEVKENAVVSAKGSGVAIYIRGSGTANIKGGTVESNTGRAIHSTSATCKVYVSGGTVKSKSSTSVIFLSSLDNNEQNIVISGSSKVIQEGTNTDNHAVVTYGIVAVEDNAEITADAGYSILLMSTAAAPTRTGSAIIKGGKVESATGVGIYAQGSDQGGKVVVVDGMVIAPSMRIYLGRNGVAYFNNGTVTASQVVASGRNSLHVRMMGTVTDPYYVSGTNAGLIVTPADASAKWAIKDGKSGINYSRTTETDTNEGFLEVPGITVLAANYTVALTPPINGTIQVWNGATTVETFPAEFPSLTKLNLKAIPNDDYEFVAWWDGNKQQDRTYELTEDISISATFKKIGSLTYTVTFIYHNGTNANLEIEVVEGETVLKPSPNPTKEGSTFLGWFLGDEEFDFTTPITSNITLNAKWDDTETPPTEYIVTFDLNYGNAKPDEVKVVANEKVEKPANPTRSGYTFDGWFEGNATVSFDFNTPITKNITLKAKWTPITGSEDVAALNLNVFPNPFEDVLRIEGAEGCILQVINGTGAVVYTQKIENFDQIVRLEQLPKGLYLFRIEKDKQVKTVKVVKN